MSWLFLRQTHPQCHSLTLLKNMALTSPHVLELLLVVYPKCRWLPCDCVCLGFKQFVECTIVPSIMKILHCVVLVDFIQRILSPSPRFMCGILSQSRMKRYLSMWEHRNSIFLNGTQLADLNRYIFDRINLVLVDTVLRLRIEGYLSELTTSADFWCLLTTHKSHSVEKKSMSQYPNFRREWTEVPCQMMDRTVILWLWPDEIEWYSELLWQYCHSDCSWLQMLVNGVEPSLN